MIYGAIRKQPDLEVAGEVSDANTILAAMEMTDPDCLVISLEQSGASLPLCRQLLTRNNRARVLAISEAADLVALCWWCEGDIRCTYMEASGENLLSALRCQLF